MMQPYETSAGPTSDATLDTSSLRQHLSYHIYRSMMTSQHTMEKLLAHQLQGVGITPGEYNILRILWDHDAVSPKGIAEQLDYTSATVSNYLKQLEKKALIWRSADIKDRRQVTIIVTPSGHALEKRVNSIAREIFSSYWGKISIYDLKRFSDFLDTIGKKQQPAKNVHEAL